MVQCNVAGFVSNNGQVERVPYVFLPQRGQIIYPHAEIRFKEPYSELIPIVTIVRDEARFSTRS
ncbi:hypothetical protein X777_01290 [Ooceraea biroi]|uniref:Uncharacterized protein n=1 Tax=Ooceraea biroi TaxID=2015173 RepID=A0A026WQV1_OOCBI|nr:hypothetical protein X777_01290 [Ooceraea biroi]